MKKSIVSRAWMLLLLPLLIDCQSKEPEGFITLNVPDNITSLYGEVAAYQPVAGTKQTSLDISSLTKNFEGVLQAFVVEYDSNYFYEPRQEVINNNTIPIISSDKNFLVVLDLGEVARNNYSLIADFSRFKELSELRVQNYICAKILCSPDVFKVDKIFNDIPELKNLNGSFDFHRGPLGKVQFVKAKSICEQCFKIPSKIFPCIYKKCPIFPFYRRPYVRKNFNTLTASEKNSFANGVGVMKSRGETLKDSWIYQANMHRSPVGTPALELFNQCEHHTLHFFTWHRMYLYYFERIVRKSSEAPRLALPYWNYSLTGSRGLPLEFIEPAEESNQLYHERRNDWANNGDELPDDLVDISGYMTLSEFDPFSTDLESNLHDGIHGQIGRDMGSTRTAGRDPIFWLHHCNIDRLWNKWVQIDGHLQPVDPGWLSQTYDFFNEHGVRVSLQVSDVLNTLDQLNYRYDDDPAAFPLFTLIRRNRFDMVPQKPTILSSVEKPIRLTENPVKITIRIPKEKIEALKSSNLSEAKKTFLVLEGIQFQEPVGTSFRVFLNPGPKENLNSPNQESFVGFLNFFGSHDDHQEHVVEFDITELLHKTANANRLSDASNVVIVPIQPVRGKNSKTKGNVSIKVQGNPMFKKISVVEK
jgi:hypothetical protein